MDENSIILFILKVFKDKFFETYFLFLVWKFKLLLNTFAVHCKTISR